MASISADGCWGGTAASVGAGVAAVADCGERKCVFGGTRRSAGAVEGVAGPSKAREANWIAGRHVESSNLKVGSGLGVGDRV